MEKIARKLITAEQPTVFSDTGIYLGTRAEIRASCSFEGPIRIGAGSICQCSRLMPFCSIGEDSFLKRAEVGRYASIGSDVNIGFFNHPTDWLSTSSFQYNARTFEFTDQMKDIELSEWVLQVRPIYVGPDAWIGSHVLVMEDVKIGAGAIVAAGSVVTKDVPPYAIVGGNPARIIRYRFDEAMIERLLKLEWWDLDVKLLAKGGDFKNIESAVSVLEERKAMQESEQDSK